VAHPRKKQTRVSLRQLSLLRKVCRALPDVVEIEAWGEPTFRHRGKMFAMFASPDTHHGDGRTAVWIKAEAHERDLLVKASPAYYFVPAYMGPSGWIGAYLDDKTNWDEVKRLLAEGHRLLGVRSKS
jgi:predicted DNA-binding protein (MmcQ/YjbR family)